MCELDDLISLKGMVFYGYHGVNDSEKQDGQSFVVDVDLGLNLHNAGQTDLLRDTIDYSAVYKVVENIMKGPSKNLLEHLAEIVADAILKEWQMNYVIVQIAKPNVQIRDAVLQGTSVRIRRFNSQTE